MMLNTDHAIIFDIYILRDGWILEARTIRLCLGPWEDGIHQLATSHGQYRQ